MCSVAVGSKAFCILERVRHADLSTTAKASLKRAANISPMKCSAKRPTAWSRELRSLREQWSRRQSFSAEMLSLRPAGGSARKPTWKKRVGSVRSGPSDAFAKQDGKESEQGNGAYSCRWWQWTAAGPCKHPSFLGGPETLEERRKKGRFLTGWGQSISKKKVNATAIISYQGRKCMWWEQLHHLGDHLQTLTQVPLPLSLLLWWTSLTEQRWKLWMRDQQAGPWTCWTGCFSTKVRKCCRLLLRRHPEFRHPAPPTEPDYIWTEYDWGLLLIEALRRLCTCWRKHFYLDFWCFGRTNDDFTTWTHLPIQNTFTVRKSTFDFSR